MGFELTVLTQIAERGGRARDDPGPAREVEHPFALPRRHEVE